LFGIKKLGLIYNHQFYSETQKSHLSWCALHGQYADSQRKSSVFHNRKQRDKTSRTGIASHSARRFCGQRFVGLGFGLFVFILFSDNGGVVFEPITSASNGDGLGVVQERIFRCDQSSRWLYKPQRKVVPAGVSLALTSAFWVSN